MMKSSELVAKVVDIAKHYKTLYVMGCFGAPLTDTNKSRYIKNHSYNMAAARTAIIMAATPDTFGFDCVNLIKAVLWGWTGDKTKSYGGAKYATNGVPDIGADTMITKCKDASASGWDKVDPRRGGVDYGTHRRVYRKRSGSRVFSPLGEQCADHRCR